MELLQPVDARRLHSNVFKVRSFLRLLAFVFAHHASRTYLDRGCLGILFSNKAFPRRVLGLAWRGDPTKNSGICQKRQSGTGVNLNALFITLRTESMERIPLRMGILNLLHEILHAFGASHDPKGTIVLYKIWELSNVLIFKQSQIQASKVAI